MLTCISGPGPSTGGMGPESGQNPSQQNHNHSYQSWKEAHKTHRASYPETNGRIANTDQTMTANQTQIRTDTETIYDTSTTSYFMEAQTSRRRAADANFCVAVNNHNSLTPRCPNHKLGAS